MLDQKTVFVVGAGASFELGLPLGNDLTSKIAARLEGLPEDLGLNSQPSDLARCLLSTSSPHKNSETRYRFFLKGARKIIKAMALASSIDDYLHKHQEDLAIQTCGKLAIVEQILESERGSELYKAIPRRSFSHLKEVWLTPFFQQLTANCQKSHLKSRLSRIAFVIFNYDRCVEIFLYLALQTLYDITPAEAAGFVDGIEICHPYGTVGAVPWAADGPIKFGAEPDFNELPQLADRIKTFGEGADANSVEIQGVKTAMDKAHAVVFLGFAFHMQNLEILNSDYEGIHSLNVFGTAFGISTPNREIISKNLKNLRSRHTSVTLADLKCREFIDQYSLSIPAFL